MDDLLAAIVMFLLVAGLLWGLPLTVAYWIGRSSGQNEGRREVRGHVARVLLDAILELDRLHAAGRLDDRQHRAARMPLERRCQAAGGLVPPPAETDGGGEAAVDEAGADIQSGGIWQTESEATPAPQQAAEEPPPAPPAPTTPAAAGEHQPADAPLIKDDAAAEIVDAELVSADEMDEPPNQEPVPVTYTRPGATSPPSSTPRGASSADSTPTPAAKPAPWDVPDKPSAPRRTWGELLQAFMEERNIRWGELLSGLLIIGSAVGLVLSLRDQLTQTIPYFPSLLFLLLTATVHGAGLYTYRRWKLETTSRGVLLIGMLLIPLGFLAACLLSGRGEVRAATDPLYLAAVVLGLAGYGSMSLMSSRILLPRHWLSLGLAVLAGSAVMLVFNRLGDGDQRLLHGALGIVAVGGAVAAAAHYLWTESGVWTRRQSEQFAMLLGLTGFAAALSLGFFTYRSGGTLAAARDMAAAVALGGALLALAGRATTIRSDELRWQITGAAITLCSLTLLAAAQVVAWPGVWPVIAAGVVSFPVLICGGVRQRSGLLTGAGLAALTPAWLVGTQLALGNYADPSASSLADHAVIVSAASGLSLSVLLAAVELLGVWRLRRGDLLTARVLMGGGGVMAAGSVALALVASARSGEFFEVQVATVLLAVYGVAALLASSMIRNRPVAVWLIAGGALLLLGGCLRATTGPAGVAAPWIAPGWTSGLVAHALAMTALALGALAWSNRQRTAEAAGEAAEEDVEKCADAAGPTRWHAQRLAEWSLVSGGAAVALQYVAAPSLPQQAAAWWIGAAVCLAAAVVHRAAGAYAAAELVGAVAVAFSAAAGVEAWGEPWQNLLDGSLFHVVMLSLAVWSAVLSWTASRRRPPWLARLAEGSLVSPLLVVLVTLACGHVVLAGTPLWQQEIYGDGYDWPWAARGAAWAAASLTALAAVVVARTRREPTAVRVEALGLLATGLVVRLSLLSAAAASSSRWLAALWSVAVALLAWRRRDLHQLWRATGGAPLDHSPPRLSLSATSSVAAPVVLLVTGLSWLALAVNGGLPAAAESAWMAAFAPLANYLVPLLLVAASLMAHAVSLRLEPAALAGAAVVVMTSALWRLQHPDAATFSETDVVQLLQWSLIAAGLWGLIWLPLRPAMHGQPRSLSWNAFLAVTMLLPMGLALWAVAAIVLLPGKQFEATAAIGDWPSYVGLAAAASLAVWHAGRRLPPWTGVVWGGVGLCASGLLAASLDAADTQRQWWAYHAMMAALTGITGIIAAVLCLPERQREALGLARGRSEEALVGSGVVLGGIVFLMAWRGLYEDPSGAVWPAGACFALTAISGVMAVRGGRRELVPAGAALVASGAAFISRQAVAAPAVWVFDAATAVVLHAAVWAALERLARDGTLRWHREPRSRFHWLAARAGGVAAVLAAGCLLLTPQNSDALLHGLVLVTAQLVLCVACLWEPRVSRRAAPLFLTGVAAVVATVATVHDDVTSRYASLVLGLSLYTVLATVIWRRREAWNRKLISLGSPPDEGPACGAWLSPALLTMAVGLTALALPGVLWCGERWMRFALAVAPLLGATAVGGSALSAEDSRRRLTSLGLGVLGLVWVSWADIDAAGGAAWLERMVRALTITSVAAGVLGGVVPRWIKPQEAWRGACRQGFLGCFVGAAALFLCLLGLELGTFQAGVGTPLSNMQAWTVTAFVAALVAALISVAVLPARDPLRLSDRARVAYTYAAQALAALLVLHLYLSMPWIFREQWRPYWPYIVMGISFAGAAAGELLQRSGLRVLGEPTVRTSLLLPVVPLLGMTVAASGGSYGHVAAMSALLFAMAAAAGRSWLCGGAAAVLANVALWSWYRETGWLTLARNPQAWLIPPALSALIAGQLYRQRLSEPQLAFLRYISVSMIYVSSASEMFIHGIGQSLWPPILLASLSVLGVLAGILIRVRAFLYFGTGFLLMSMVAMVSHATRAFHHVWPWWAFGITLGAAILVMFGIFEKRRDDMRLMLDKLRQWDA